MAGQTGKLKYESSCFNCKFWQERKESNVNGPINQREGICQGKYNGDFVTANQYCLGFVKK
jgi:hypothetical protein